MKKRFFSLMLALVMVLSMIPMTSLTAFAWDEYIECEFCGEGIADDWICSGGDHCGPDGNSDCWEEHHCIDCYECETNVDEWCEECYMCISCALGNNTHCIECGICSIDAGQLCEDCGQCDECCGMCSDEYVYQNPDWGNTEEDIIKTVTYSLQSDRTYDATVTIDISCVDQQARDHVVEGIGFHYYDQNNVLKIGSVGGYSYLETEYTFKVASGLLPDKEWALKVYLGEDYYADYELSGYDFNYVYLTAPGYSIYVGGVGMFDGDYIAVGATETTSEEPNGGFAYYAYGELFLYNYEYEGQGYIYNAEDNWGAIVYAEDELYIYFLGENTLTQTDEMSDSVYFVSGGEIYGEGSLNISGGYYGAWSDYGDLIIDGATVTIDNCGTALYSDNNIIINGGTLELTAEYNVFAASGDLTINGSNIIAKSTEADPEYESDYTVFFVEGTLAIDSALKVEASTEPDGTLGKYVAEENYTYDYIKISAPGVCVGGVGMFDSEYLAVGATETQTTKPSGGYAYYKNGTLTLDNYEYEGQGYIYDKADEYGAIVYADKAIDIVLVGENIFVQTDNMSDNIVLNYGGTIDGSGTLITTNGYYVIYFSYGDLAINGGTIISENCHDGIFAYSDLIINGGTIDITAKYYGVSMYGDVNINGGNITLKTTSEESDYRAMLIDGALTINPALTVKASVDPDGTLDEYVAEELNTYKLIVIEGCDMVFGDVDNDGDVDSIDYLFVKRYCLGTYDLIGDAFTCADVNKNGSVDSIDYLLVKRIVLGTYSA